VVHGSNRSGGGFFPGLDDRLFAFHVSHPPFAFDHLVVLFSHISLYFAFLFRFCVVTMVTRPAHINLILLALLLPGISGLAGCNLRKLGKDHDTATLRVHLECNPQLLDRVEKISVLRAAPMQISIERYPFLSEKQIESARVLDRDTGHVLSIKFNQEGTRLLEHYSALNSYKRFAIRSQFRQETNVFDRWLAAPVIRGRIGDGVLTFSPDASREECDVLVRGWNKVAGFKMPPENKKPAAAETP
jgi:hypothetical protein